MEKLTMGQTCHRTRRRGARGVRATAAATSAASQRSRKSGAGALHLLIRPVTPGWLLGEGQHLVWNRRKQVIREREKENTFRTHCSILRPMRGAPKSEEYRDQMGNKLCCVFYYKLLKRLNLLRAVKEKHLTMTGMLWRLHVRKFPFVYIVFKPTVEDLRKLQRESGIPWGGDAFPETLDGRGL